MLIVGSSSFCRTLKKACHVNRRLFELFCRTLRNALQLVTWTACMLFKLLADTEKGLATCHINRRLVIFIFRGQFATIDIWWRSQFRSLFWSRSVYSGSFYWLQSGFYFYLKKFFLLNLLHFFAAQSVLCCSLRNCIALCLVFSCSLLYPRTILRVSVRSSKSPPSPFSYFLRKCTSCPRPPPWLVPVPYPFHQTATFS